MGIHVRFSGASGFSWFPSMGKPWNGKFPWVPVLKKKHPLVSRNNHDSRGSSTLRKNHLCVLRCIRDEHPQLPAVSRSRVYPLKPHERAYTFCFWVCSKNICCQVTAPKKSWYCQQYVHFEDHFLVQEIRVFLTWGSCCSFFWGIKHDLPHAIGPRLWTTSRTAWATWNGAGAQAGGMETGYHGIHGIFQKSVCVCVFFLNGIL